MELTGYGYVGAAVLVVGFIIAVIYMCKKYYEAVHLIDEADEAQPLV